MTCTVSIECGDKVIFGPRICATDEERLATLKEYDELLTQDYIIKLKNISDAKEVIAKIVRQCPTCGSTSEERITILL